MFEELMMVDAVTGLNAQVQGLNLRQGDGSVAKGWLLIVVSTDDAPVVEHMEVFAEVGAPFDRLAEKYPDSIFEAVE